MPTYCYELGNGQVIEKEFAMGAAPRCVRVGRSWARRSFAAERTGTPAPKGWPLECVASGVHPSQAGELREHLRKSGVPTEISRDGNPIYRNPLHRKRALHARGLVDRNSFL